MGYGVFPDVNRIDRPKAVISIPDLLGHYRQLRIIDMFFSDLFKTQERVNVDYQPKNTENISHQINVSRSYLSLF